jgi:hypothetical protein
MNTAICKTLARQRQLSLLFLFVILMLGLSAAASVAAAQELTLFEPVASSAANTAAEPRPQPVAPASTQPRFTLVGTSRFGDNYRVHLREQGGDTLTVNVSARTNARDSAPIPGHDGYSVSGIGSRHVAINHPGNTPCVAAPDKGVSCEGASTSRLQVATAAPIQVQEPQPPQRRRDRRGAGNGAENGDAEEPQNPFAAALRAARERNPEDEAVMRAQAERFERRRIDPSQVPEGYRVVRTPFGDRVIEIQQQ